MSEAEPSQIDQDVVRIFERLQRDKQKRSDFPILPPEGSRPYSTLGTPGARSIEEVDKKELVSLNQTVQRIREQIRTKKQTLATHPDRDYWRAHGLRAEEDEESLFWERAGELEVIMDDDLPESTAQSIAPQSSDVLSIAQTIGYRLAVAGKLPFLKGIAIDLEFGFINNFRLSLIPERELFHRSDPYNSSDYNSSTTLDEMTGEEYRLITRILEEYLKLSNQKTNEQPPQ